MNNLSNLIFDFFFFFKQDKERQNNNLLKLLFGDLIHEVRISEDELIEMLYHSQEFVLNKIKSLGNGKQKNKREINKRNHIEQVYKLQLFLQLEKKKIKLN